MGGREHTVAVADASAAVHLVAGRCLLERQRAGRRPHSHRPAVVLRGPRPHHLRQRSGRLRRHRQPAGARQPGHRQAHLEGVAGRTRRRLSASGPPSRAQLRDLGQPPGGRGRRLPSAAGERRRACGAHGWPIPGARRELLRLAQSGDHGAAVPRLRRRAARSLRSAERPLFGERALTYRSDDRWRNTLAASAGVVWTTRRADPRAQSRRAARAGA